MISLFFGVPQLLTHKSKDYISVKKNFNISNLHKFNGKITGKKLTESNEIIYLDGIVKITTVKPDDRKNAIEKINKELNKLGVLFLTSAGLSIGSIGYFVCGYTYLPVVIGAIALTSVTTCLLSGHRYNQFAKEMENWKDKTEYYQSIRRDLLSYGSLNLKTLDYKNTYLANEEATKIWQDEIRSIINEIIFKEKSYLNIRIDLVRKLVNKNLLERDVINYFYDSSKLVKSYTKCDKVIEDYKELTTSFSKNKNILERSEKLEINNNTNNSFSAAVKHGARIVRDVDNLTDDDKAHNLVRNTTTDVISDLTDLKINEGNRKISQKYNKEINATNSKYREDVAKLLPEFRKIYSETNAVTTSNAKVDIS
jgi:hypothetical protein